MASKLDQLRAMTVVVGDTGDIDAIRRLRPQDCTTNPSLILKAVSTPAGAEIMAEAIRWADGTSGTLAARTIAACDRIAVAIGSELTRLVPGRVSTEVDADLSFDTRASVEKAQALIAAYAARGVPREEAEEEFALVGCAMARDAAHDRGESVGGSNKIRVRVELTKNWVLYRTNGEAFTSRRCREKSGGISRNRVLRSGRRAKL